MRRIFQFDGSDDGLLSIGECREYETIAICIKDRNGHETQILLSQENFRALCGLSHEIHWNYRPETEEKWRLLIQAPERKEQEAAA
jgi:hypothetical protein